MRPPEKIIDAFDDVLERNNAGSAICPYQESLGGYVLDASVFAECDRRQDDRELWRKIDPDGRRQWFAAKYRFCLPVQPGKTEILRVIHGGYSEVFEVGSHGSRRPHRSRRSFLEVHERDAYVETRIEGLPLDTVDGALCDVYTAGPEGISNALLGVAVGHELRNDGC